MPRKILFVFGKYLPFSKYVTRYDTFTTLVQSVICFVEIKTERDNFFTKCLYLPGSVFYMCLNDVNKK